MYQIGEFSAKTGTSIRTLHYYDEIGLLTPKKHPTSGHRLYSDNDVLKLQKIISLKFLGYSLEQISEMMKESSFDMSLAESLQIQKKALEDEKEQIETALLAINRTIALLQDEGEVDSAILMSIINGFQTIKTQREWLEQYTAKEVVDQIMNKTEEENIALDKEYIRLSKEVKRLFGQPIDDPEVQNVIDQYLKAMLQFLGEEAIQTISTLNVTEADELQAFENSIPSPFTKEEEEWLNKVMEYYMIQHEMIDVFNDMD